jgi:exoribonuclease R
MDKEQCLQIIQEYTNIVGILSTSQQVKYGKTNNGKPIYQIKPIKGILPPFWITYGGKLQGKILINFKFKNWPSDSKLPFGEIIDIIGLADDNNLSKALIFHYQVQRKNFKNIPSINEYESKIVRKDLRNLDIFSIDPKGCVDIDDALSLEITNDKIIIGVHIAQPICWLTKDNIVERSTTAFSTLYLEENKHLWSEEITLNASLIENKEKPAYSILFTIEGSTISFIESFPSTIINKLNTNYDDIHKYKNIIKCKEITEKILQKEIDSHELVSFWMVKANVYIGNTFDNIPFRIQNEKECNIIKKVDNDTIQKIFDNMNLEGASYSYNETKHYSLDVNRYTHFTSPIRRIIDTIIHWNITYSDNLQIDVNIINKLDYKTKKFHRQLNLMNIIKDLPNEFETYGYIYSKQKNSFYVYFEELGFHKVTLWSSKFNYLENKEINIDEYEIGKKYSFKISKKPGFMPSQKILIILKLNI